MMTGPGHEHLRRRRRRRRRHRPGTPDRVAPRRGARRRRRPPGRGGRRHAPPPRPRARRARSLADAVGAPVVGHGHALLSVDVAADGGQRRWRGRPRPRRVAHPGARVGPPVLLRAVDGLAVHRRPPDAGLDGRHPPARRRPHRRTSPSVARVRDDRRVRAARPGPRPASSARRARRGRGGPRPPRAARRDRARGAPRARPGDRGDAARATPTATSAPSATRWRRRRAGRTCSRSSTTGVRRARVGALRPRRGLHAPTAT